MPKILSRSFFVLWSHQLAESFFFLARVHRICVVLIGAAITLLCLSAQGQVSPGPLSRAHQSLSGPTQCVYCHKLGAGSAEFRCLECHTEIRNRLDARRGLHATLVPERNEKTCAGCHSEHNGENFQLVRWVPSLQRFDHSKTGYSLEGKHAGLECSKCHSPERIPEAERATIRMKDLRRTFLGLPRDCLACHQDAHRGQLGKDCQRCHTPDGWKSLAQFDHARTRFPLTGKHGAVACQKCHPATGPGETLQLKGIRFDTCAACHADPHKGSFTATCSSCHSTTSWKQVALAGKFDHAKTDFPLLGRHAQVACSGCHLAGDFRRPLNHAKCADCHKPDPHGGQFRARPEGGDCAACHTLEGFQPAKFGLPEHAATQYPLEGKHAAVPCEKCHTPAGKATLYRIEFARCTNCHADPHAAQFAAPPHNNRCEGCHTVQGYRPSSYTLARHQQSRFPLTGGHVAVPCVECHRSDASRKPPVPARYRMEERSCTACHTDPHKGQFAERMAQKTATGAVSGCEVCHSTKTWRDLARFDHATTRFPLTGTHRAVACASCHRPPNLETTLRNVNFQSAPSECKKCHDDEHAGQFARSGKNPGCADCHNTSKWKPSLFDHDRGTAFPLVGGHEAVPCGSCHSTRREAGGKRVLFYRPTPTECAACHGR